MSRHDTGHPAHAHVQSAPPTAGPSRQSNLHLDNKPSSSSRPLVSSTQISEQRSLPKSSRSNTYPASITAHGLSKTAPIDLTLSDSDDSLPMPINPVPMKGKDKGKGRLLAFTDSLESISSSSSGSLKCLSSTQSLNMSGGKVKMKEREKTPGKKADGDAFYAQLKAFKEAGNAEQKRLAQARRRHGGRPSFALDGKDQNNPSHPLTSISPDKPTSSSSQINKSKDRSPSTRPAPKFSANSNMKNRPSFLRNPSRPKAPIRAGPLNDPSKVASLKAERRTSLNDTDTGEVLGLGSTLSSLDTDQPASKPPPQTPQAGPSRIDQDRASSQGGQRRDKSRSMSPTKQRARTPKPTMEEWQARMAMIKQEAEQRSSPMKDKSVMLADAKGDFSNGSDGIQEKATAAILKTNLQSTFMKGLKAVSMATPPTTNTKTRVTTIPSSQKQKRQKNDRSEAAYRIKSKLNAASTAASGSASSSRPHRVRPEPGAYTLPQIDTPIHDWPLDKSSHSASASRSKAKADLLTSTQATPNDKSITKTNASPIIEPMIGHRRSSLLKTPSLADRSQRSDSTLTPLASPGKSPRKLPSASLSPTKRLVPLGQPTANPTTALRDLIESHSESPRIADAEGAVDAGEEELEIDILAEFDDFDWAAPSEPEPGQAEGAVVQQPSAIATSGQLTSVSSLSKVSERVPVVPDTIAMSPTTPRKRRRSNSPSSAHKRQAHAEMFSQMVEDEKARRAAEREEAKHKEEELAKKVAGALDDNESDEEREEEDLGAFLDTIKDSPKKASGTISAVRQRSNDKQAQLAARESERRNKRAEEEAKKRQAKHREETRMFDKILRAGKGNALASETLKMLEDQSDDKEGEEWTYPTPNSEDFEVENSALDISIKAEVEMDVDQVVKELKDQGMNIDDTLIRDGKITAVNPNQSSKALQWEGFWSAGYETINAKLPTLDIETKDETLSLIKQLASDGDADTLAAIVSTGLLDNLPRANREYAEQICRWLLTSALSNNSHWVNVALSSLLAIYDTEESDHISIEIGEIAPTIFARLHTRQAIIASLMQDDRFAWLSVQCEREWGCAVVCRMLAKSATLGNISVEIISQIVPVLLLLSVDAKTSSALQRDIHDTLSTLLDGIVGQEAIDIAKAVIASTTTYEMDLQVAILQVIGERTKERAMVYRWLGAGWLIPGSLNALDPSETPTVPHIPLLEHGAEFILELVRSREEHDWAHLNRLVTLLYAAMSNTDSLVELYPPDQKQVERLGGVKEYASEHELEDVRRVIRQARDKISDQSNGTERSIVKGRLHQLAEMTRIKLGVALKKSLRAKKLGKNLERGEKGQTKLVLHKMS